MSDMRYVLLFVIVGALACAPAGLAEGAYLKQPLNGSAVSSLSPVEFTWDNPTYHVLGLSQVFYVATDPDFTNVVWQHGDWCPPLATCPQGTTAGPFAPGVYYWKIHLYAWDWNPDSDIWSFVSSAPPPPPPPPPPTPPAQCRVPGVVGKLPARARNAILRASCRVGAVRRSYSTARHKGRIVAQRPRAGALVAAGTRVHLVVGRGRR